jgi:perosamine synthetase
MGDVGIFSFSMPKIITTGQGGALVTNNDEIA